MVWTQFTTGTDPKIEKLTFGFYWRCLFDWWMVNLLEAGTHLNCHDFWGQLQKYLCTCRYVLLYYKRESLDTYIGVECASICATPIYQLSCQEFEKRIQDTSWSTILWKSSTLHTSRDFSRRVIQCTFCLTLFVFQSVSQQPPYMNMSSTIKKKVTLCETSIVDLNTERKDRQDATERPRVKKNKEREVCDKFNQNSLWQYTLLENWV